MKWTLLMTLQEGCLLLTRHPEFLIPSLVTLFIFFLYRQISQSGSNFAVNWPFLGMLPTIIANHHRLHDHVTSLLQESKHTFMFKVPWLTGMDILVTCDPANANHMFNANFSNYPKGEEFSEIFDILGDGILSADGDLWMFQRRMAHAHMSDPRFRSLVATCTRNKVGKVLLPLLNHMAGIGKVVDLSDVLLRFTFDTTFTFVYGIDPSSLALNFPTIPFAEATHVAEQQVVYRHITPMVWWKLLRYLRVGKEREMAEAMEVVDHFIAQIIRERREGVAIDNEERCSGEASFDMLTAFMDSKSFKSNDKFLRDVLLAFLVAGKDSTGSAMAWFLWLVANNPHVEKKILEELRELRLDAEMVVFDAEKIDTLVYLHAAVCESQRLYPAIPFNHKKALKADVLPSGHKVRPGTMVIFSNYSMGRMEGIWGPDCLEFKPERWITEKGTFTHFPSYKFIAFHSGPRSCLGKNVALTQIKMLASAVIYNFNIQLVEGYVAEPKISAMLQTKNGLLVKLTKRNISGY